MPNARFALAMRALHVPVPKSVSLLPTSGIEAVRKLQAVGGRVLQSRFSVV